MQFATDLKMPLAFPIAADLLAALDSGRLARTIADARVLAGEPVSLVSGWLRPTEEEHSALKARLEAGVTQGFVQIYEDAKGRPVAAVTYWRPHSAPGDPQSPPVPAPADAAPAAEDHTDDLYFDKAQKTRCRKRGAPDPNQMDLFGPARPVRRDDDKA